MEITINNSLKEIPENSTVQDMVTHLLADKQKGVAVAINNSVVPKTEWEKTFLQSKDNILIIKATQGG